VAWAALVLGGGERLKFRGASGAVGQFWDLWFFPAVACGFGGRRVLWFCGVMVVWFYGVTVVWFCPTFALGLWRAEGFVVGQVDGLGRLGYTLS